jgi:hypothetical protein
MLTITINLYEFKELSEDIKQKVLGNLHDINVDFDWWGSIYDDAENVFIEIEGFVLGRGENIDMKFTSTPHETADKIISEHGEVCETRKTAEAFLKGRDSLVKKYSDGIALDKVSEDNEAEFDEDCDILEAEFLKDIGNDYLTMLKTESVYLMSEEAIVETILSNGYTFEENGVMRNK